MPNTVIIRANAKVNIGLHLVGKRPDGYHLLETLYFPISSLADTVWVEKRPGNECKIDMIGFKEKVPLESNLCYRAWAIMAEQLEKKETGVRIRVQKGIPAGAGLGGGSADAAAVLKALRSIWQPDIKDEKLAEWGAKLGADVPFFIYNKPMYATGIGTHLEPMEVAIQDYELELRIYQVHSSTVQAYKDVLPEDIGHTVPLRELLELPVEEWRGRVKNDLEIPVFKRYPALRDGIEELYREGAVYASMSGSGSALYGLFRKR